MDQRERLLHLEERLEALAQADGEIDLLAQLLEHGADPARILQHALHVALRLLVVLGHALRALAQLLNLTGDPGHRLEALLQLLEPRGRGARVLARPGDGIPELVQRVLRGVRGLEQLGEALALLPHLGEHRAHVFRELPILGAVAEQILE